MKTFSRGLNRASFLLAVLLFASSCVPTTDAPVPEAPESTARALGGPGSRLRPVHVIDEGGEGVPSLPDLIDWMENMHDLNDLLGGYLQCVGQGLNAPGCSAKDMAWRGLCMVLDWRISDMLLFDIGIPFYALCAGDPPLKCCKYEPAPENGCHSALNSDDPINCEGNYVFPFAESYGVCIPARRFEGDPGCYCDYLAACNVPVVERTGASDWRLNELGVRLARAIEEGSGALLRQQPADFMDYVSLVGFRAHREVILTGAPYSKPDEFPPGYTLSPAYHESDNVPEARYLRGLTTLAIQRVFAGIPNLQARWNAIASRRWTEPEKVAYLANIPDPEAVLEGCVGEFGVDMLRQAHPGEYLLLAAPLQGETEPDCPAGWVGGAAIGAAPSLGVTTSTSGATVTLALTVQDPNASDNADGAYVVQLDWGDGLVEGRAYVIASPSTHAWTHAFETAGTYTVTARIINTSGLVGETTAQVAVAEGSGLPVRRSVESVQFALEASVTANSHGRVRVDVEGTDARGTVHKLGYHWVTLAGAPGGTNVTVPLTSVLNHGGLTDLQSFRLKPSFYEGYGASLRLLRLSGVTLNLHASPGMSPQSRSYVLTNRDVKVYAAGASVPTAPLMQEGTGKLELPLMDAEIVIDLPASTEPDPEASYGCRPVYGTDTPLMRTANGGCEDIASGLVFAIVPAHGNWHDAIWDSSVPGSAPPDAHDYGRLNDYPGGYPIAVPDTSAAAFCHALSQGGFSDWRLPSEAELDRVASASRAKAYFPHTTWAHAWTSVSWGATQAVTTHLESGSRGYADKAAGSARVVCVRSAPPPTEHVCQVPSDGEQLFVTGSGGCMDTRAGGLVWSRPSVPVKTWHDAVWGSELAGNAPPDTHDGARANDYLGGIVPGFPDASLENACHALVEGGFSDWRLPTEWELRTVGGSARAAKYFAFNTAENFWSSTTYNAPGSSALSVNLSSNGLGYDPKTGYRRVVCVRTPAAMAAADLTPTAFSGPSSAATRQPVSLSWSVTNQGSLNATPTWRDIIYLSQDTHPGRDDAQVLDEARGTVLAPGASYSVTRSVALPNVPAGNYYLLLRTDPTAIVLEKDDGNNGWAALPITVSTADLVAGGLTAPASARAGASVTLTWSVSNGSAGVTAHPSWQDHVLLSMDAACCTGDTALTNATRSTALAPGANYSVTRTFTLPANLTPGAYNLILSVDRTSVLAETNEENNGVVVPFTVDP